MIAKQSISWLSLPLYCIPLEVQSASSCRSVHTTAWVSFTVQQVGTIQQYVVVSAKPKLIATVVEWVVSMSLVILGWLSLVVVAFNDIRSEMLLTSSLSN